MTLMCCGRQSNGPRWWKGKGLAPHTVTCRGGDGEEARAYAGRTITQAKHSNMNLLNMYTRKLLCDVDICNFL